MKLKVVITNNPKVRTYYESLPMRPDYDLVFTDVKKEVLICSRDLIHKNWKLLNHTMVGNIPIYKHPYRTLVLQKNLEFDAYSLELIEQAMEHINRGKQPEYTAKVLEDFQELDFILFNEVKI